MSIPKKIRIPESVLSRTVGTETILFDLQSSSYYSLNEVGGRFWKLIQEGNTIAQILSVLTGEFEVDSDRLEGDIELIAKELQKLGLLEVVEETP